MAYKVEGKRRFSPCRFRNWTIYEKGLIVNGCGGKGGWLKPPAYRFTASCNHHDANYWLGGTEEDRKEADLQFLKCMKYDATRGSNFFSRMWMKGAAYRYYWAVRWCGRKFFHYRQGEPETNKQQWNRLEKVISAKEI